MNWYVFWLYWLGGLGPLIGGQLVETDWARAFCSFLAGLYIGHTAVIAAQWWD